jgi:S1-C subfamily serine protease
MIRSIPLLLMLLAATTPTAKSKPLPGWLGMGYVWSSDRAHKVLHVQRVTHAGPADAAGIKAGDIITTIDGRNVDFGDELDLLLYLGDRKPGERVTFGVVREGRLRNIRVTLRSMPEASRAAWNQNLEIAKRKRIAAHRQP